MVTIYDREKNERGDMGKRDARKKKGKAKAPWWIPSALMLRQRQRLPDGHWATRESS